MFNDDSDDNKPPVYGKRNSTTGGRGPREVDQTNWRTKLMTNRIKFDDAAKRTFLEHFAKTNRLMEACAVAGVTRHCVHDHQRNDPDFAEAYEDAKQRYRDSLHQHAEDLIFNGVEKPVIGGRNKDIIIATTVEYPIPLLQMELKRVDPDYKDRQVVENTGGGSGVVLIPAHMDAEDWIKEQMEKNAQRKDPSEEATPKISTNS
jgi:hypothetical protein